MDLVNIETLQQELRTFAEERDWARFHDPKNLVMALVGEAGELAAVLQWVSNEESVAAVDVGGQLRADFASEMADVMIYLARLADVTNLPLAEAVAAKMATNVERFPAET